MTKTELLQSARRAGEWNDCLKVVALDDLILYFEECDGDTITLPFIRKSELAKFIIEIVQADIAKNGVLRHK